MTARGAGAGAVPDKPFHLLAQEQVVKYDVLPGGEVEGTRRGVANGVATTSTMVNRLEMPPGQSSPKRQFTGDHVIYQLAGTVAWDVEGVVYRLGPGDMLFFPPDTTYSFANVGDDVAQFLDVAGRVDDWPPRMKYEDGTEISSGTLDQLFN
jgi:quercetin dioxygenase-like cupin family protein